MSNLVGVELMRKQKILFPSHLVFQSTKRFQTKEISARQSSFKGKNQDKDKRQETRDKRQKDRGKRQKTKYEKKILKESDQTGKKIRYSKKSYCQNTKKVNSKRDIQ